MPPELQSPEIQAFAAGFPTMMLHGGVTLMALILAAAIYVVLTPHKEIALIREANAAAALSLGSVLVGLAIPLTASLLASETVLEIVLWAVATVFIQLLAFRLVDLLLTGLSQRIQDGEMAAAVLLASAKLGSALILAGAVSG